MGFSVIALKPRSKIASVKNWQQYCTTCSTAKEIEIWWRHNKDANIGIACGPANRKFLFVVDQDVLKDDKGNPILDKKGNIKEKGDISGFPPTLSQTTGSGGKQLFYWAPIGKVIKNRIGFRKLVDIKSAGGYVVVSPSIHPNGKEYKWNSEPNISEITTLTEEEIDRLLGKEEKDKTDWNSLSNTKITKGMRNTTATKYVGKLLHDLSPEMWDTAGWSALVDWNQNQAVPPLPTKELKQIFNSIKVRQIASRKKSKKEDVKKDKRALILEELDGREDVVLFHDEQDRGYIAINIDGARKVLPCNGRSLRMLLSKMSWDMFGESLNTEQVKSIQSALEGNACFKGTQIPLSNRVCMNREGLWYDLANENGQAIKVTNEGWEVVNTPPILFKRYSHHKEQVIPIAGGDVELFLKYINILNPEHKLLLLVFLVSCFIPGFPHAMLAIFGAQGSSKSTLSKLARQLVDPSLVDVSGLPNNQKELVQTLAHHHFIFFDNLSYLSEEASDTICKAITGSGFSKRELYENDEDVIYNFMRCIGINGINLVATRPDLLERSILLELNRIEPSSRKSEKEIYTNFKEDLPKILGGVFDVLVKALKIRPNIEVSLLPRMADFSLWGCAIAEALGYTKDEFLNAYRNNINHQTEMLIQENIVATAIIAFMEDKKEWEDTPTQLYDQLSSGSSFISIDVKDKSWPKGAAALSRKLNEFSTPLKQMGISVTIKTHGTRRSIRLEKTA